MPPIRAADLRRAVLWAAALLLVSWVAVSAGIWLGNRYVQRGPGHPGYAGVQADLFRFDASQYKSIADEGYVYNGDPYSGPNIVFAPLYPMLVRLASRVTGVNTLAAGFALNKVLFFLALALLFLCLREWIGQARAIFVLAAMATAAGSYAFHAYYTESTFLFFLGLGLLAYARGWWAVTAVAAAALGASRLTGLPIALVFAGLLCLQIREEHGPRRWRFVAYALFCLAGAAAYLIVIGMKFGNPFALLDTIQRASWGRFHRDTDWLRLLTGGYLFEYWGEAFRRGPHTVRDIPTLNLLWMTLGLASVVYLVVVWRRHLLTYVFAPYVLMVYYTNITSHILGSVHRYFTLIFPIFMMFADLHRWLARRVSPILAWAVSGVLLALNCAYGLLHTAAFNQGVWFWF